MQALRGPSDAGRAAEGVALGARSGATRRGGNARGAAERRSAAGNEIKSGRRSSSCPGSSRSWVRAHARLRSPCRRSDSCQRDSCWGCLRQAWQRSWAWIEGRSATGSEACGFLPRKGSQRSRHSCRQVAGSQVEFQLLQPSNYQGVRCLFVSGPEDTSNRRNRRRTRLVPSPSGTNCANGSTNAASFRRTSPTTWVPTRGQRVRRQSVPGILSGLGCDRMAKITRK